MSQWLKDEDVLTMNSDLVADVPVDLVLQYEQKHTKDKVYNKKIIRLSDLPRLTTDVG